MRSVPLVVLRTACLVMVISRGPARAADSGAESRLREALRSTSAQVRALEDERAQWQVTDAQQKREIESLKSQLAAVPKETQASKEGMQCSAQLKRLRAEQSERASATAKLEESLTHCEAAAFDTAALVRAREEQAAKQVKEVAPEVAGLTERLKDCEGKNHRMFQVAKEILDQMWKNGAGEPILGLKRVEMENFAQDAEDKLLEAKVKP